jgi:hypothetical protein
VTELAASFFNGNAQCRARSLNGEKIHPVRSPIQDVFSRML